MPLCTPIGPLDARIVLLGEAPGESEELAGTPFVGASGQELDRCLVEAGLAHYESYTLADGRQRTRVNRSSLHICNVFPERPPNNNLEAWTVGKRVLPPGYNLEPLSKGKYLDPSKVHYVESCLAHLRSIKPNIIVALGATALWALTGSSAIGSNRGAVVPTPYGKVLPSYHPANILRVWGNRPILVADLIKARLHSESPDYIRPSRRLLIQPTLAEVLEFEQAHLKNAAILSVDVETKSRSITSVCLAPSRDLGIVIPFWDSRQPDGNYWRTATEERLAKRVVRRAMAGPSVKLFQNGLYDIQYFLAEGMPINRPLEDTMIASHALYLEMNKSLGFLGSIHTDEPAWKLMRRRKADTTKREE